MEENVAKGREKMSHWGMGVTHSDDYREIYDRFIEEYDEGKPIRNITDDILEKWLEEFDENDEVLHDVYFALGKAQWMCGGITKEILEKIEYIVESDSNIKCLRELEASEIDLKIRRRNLYKFLERLKKPREKARKRKVPVDKYVPKEKPPKLPVVQEGDIYAIENNGKYSVFTVTKKGRICEHQAAYVYAWRKSFTKIPDYSKLLKEDVFPLGWIRGIDFPHKDQLIKTGNYPEIKQLDLVYLRGYHDAWKGTEHGLAKQSDILEEYPKEVCVPMEVLFEKIAELKRLSRML